MSAADKLDLANSQILADLTQAMDIACLVVERDAKKLCPVDEGLLRASITHDIDNSAEQITGLIGSNLEYAPFVHQGTGIYAIDGKGRKTPWVWAGQGKWKGVHRTVGQLPKPFLKTAVDLNKDKILEIFKQSQRGIKVD